MFEKYNNIIYINTLFLRKLLNNIKYNNEIKWIQKQFQTHVRIQRN